MQDADFSAGEDAHLLPRSRLHRWLAPVCDGFALAGGGILLLLIAMSLVSIIGRKLFSTPVRGDMELMEMGAAIAIATFLPLCELHGLHLKADAFTLWLSEKGKRLLDIFAHILLCLAALLLAWRTGLQVMSAWRSGGESALLSLPMWLPLSCIVPSLLLLALCGLARALDLCLPKLPAAGQGSSA